MQNKIANYPHKKLRHMVALPFIISMIIPFIILDIMIEIYHHVAFPLYGIPVNRRQNYVRIDRGKLQYLNFWNKLSCMYCGYANGIAAYTVKIAGDTEKYWCGIKHKSGGGFIEPAHHKDFLPYGDERAYKEFLNKG